MEKKQVTLTFDEDIVLDLIQELNWTDEKLGLYNQLWTLREILEGKLKPKPKDEGSF